MSPPRPPRPPRAWADPRRRDLPLYFSASIMITIFPLTWTFRWVHEGVGVRRFWEFNLKLSVMQWTTVAHSVQRYISTVCASVATPACSLNRWVGRSEDRWCMPRSLTGSRSENPRGHVSESGNVLENWKRNGRPVPRSHKCRSVGFVFTDMEVRHHISSFSIIHCHARLTRKKCI